MTWTVHVRDSGLLRVAEVEDFQELALSLRFNGVSEWEVKLPPDSGAAALMVRGSGVVVSKDGTVVLSGPLTRRERVWGAETFLRVAGVDDTVWLQRRLVPPVPLGPPYGAAEFDVRTGIAEVVMRAYVSDHAGPTAKAERRIPGLALGTLGNRGTSVTGRGRFQTLLELLSEVAFAGGDLGFRIVQSGTGLEFQVYAPRDQSAVAKFSEELGNLAAYSFVEEAPTVDYAIAGGDGEGVDRIFYESPNSQGILDWGRIEGFLDRRDTGDVDEMFQALAETLTEGAGKVTAAVSPVDTEAVQFLREYALGDRVTLVTEEGEVTDVVRSMSIRLTPERGQLVAPEVNPAAVVGLMIGTPIVAVPAPVPTTVGGATSPTVFVTAPPPAPTVNRRTLLRMIRQ